MKDFDENNEVKEETTDTTNSDNSVSLEEENTEEKEEQEPEMVPIVEVETTYDYKVLKYCNMYVIRVKRKSILINLIMAAVCVAIGGLILYSSLKNNNNNWIFSILTFLLAAWVVYSIFTEERRIDKSLVNYFKRNAPVKQKFSFDNEKIRITAVINGENRQADYPWAYVTEIHAIPEYFFLFVNGGAPIVVDRNPEAIVSGTMEDLENLIKEECSLKPFKSYDKPLVKRMAEVTYYEPVIMEEDKEEQSDNNENQEVENNEEDKNE